MSPESTSEPLATVAGDSLQQTSSLLINTTERQSAISGLVPFELYVNVVQTTACVDFLIALFGIVTNVINLRTFLAMEAVLTDGVILTFFTLAISDLGYCTFSLCWCVCAFCFALERRFMATSYIPFFFPVDPRALGSLSHVFMVIFSVSTTLITIYLAVMRCLCVAQPLKFRGSVSPSKTALILAGFFMFAFGAQLPVFAHIDMRVKFDPRTNVTRVGLWYHQDYEGIKNIVRSITVVGLPIVAELTLTLSVIVMARALRASNQFRSSTASGADTKTASESIAQDRTQTKHIQCSDSAKEVVENGSQVPSNKSHGGKLSTKDARVVKQLMIISLIYVLCTIPKLGRTLGDAIEPEFILRGRYKNLFDIVSHIQFIAETLNSSVNLFIYLYFNTRFRTKFLGDASK